MRDKIISILKTKVYIYDKKLSYFLDDIEKIYDIVQSKILDIDCKNNILVSSERIGIDVCLLVIVAINTYLEDLKNYNNNIVSNLKTDQVVMYKGRKYKYKGCEVDKSGYFKDTEYIVLEARNGIQKIFKSDAYKLTRYFGKSEKLDKMGKNNESKEGRKLISKLLDLDINQLVGVLNQQILVVFKSKKYMQHILENLKIEINQQKYEFGTVFPARYYSDIDNFIDIKGNKLHLQNIFLFTSRFDVADLLIGEYSNCNKLILLEEESYYKSISIIEDYILDEEQLEKVIFYNTYNHIDRIVNLIENDASVYAIGEKENLKVKNILVESSKINGLLYITKTQLKSLLKPEFDFVKKDEFIKNTFKLLKIFQLICIPINKFNEKYIIDRGIKIINKITENTYQYTTIYEKLKCICENLRDLYDLLYTSNPKLNILEYISDKNSTIILNNNSEIEFISKNKKIKFKKLESINNLNNLKLQNQKLIFMSFYNNKYINQFNLYNNNNIINILYYIEAIKYNSIANNINRNLSIMYNNLNYVFEKNYIDLIKYDYKKIKKKENHDKKIEEDSFKYDYEEVYYKQYSRYEDTNNECYFDFFDKTQEILNKNFRNNSIYDYDLNVYESRAYKKILFKNNKYVYLTKNYKASCIDDKNNYITKNVDNLNINDTMVFINKKSERDIDIMFEEIIDNDIFKKQYSKDFENLNYFKKAISDYANSYEDGFKLLSMELELFNIHKNQQAIKQWTENKIVGPREKEVYKVMGKIIRNERLLNEWEDIYNSSQIIRNFKSKLKKIFKNTLRSNISEEIDDEVIKLIIDVFGNKEEYIDLVEINQIVNLSNKQEIDVKLNCLLD